MSEVLSAQSVGKFLQNTPSTCSAEKRITTLVLGKKKPWRGEELSRWKEAIVGLRIRRGKGFKSLTHAVGT